MKILTVIGARPQFIKAAPLSLLIKKKYKSITEVIIHTGQHFDKNMSDVFFKDLGMDKPKYNLSISNLSHGAMTGRMIEAIEDILKIEKPNYLLVYGDTNSTLAAAIAAIKLNIKIVHIEAGLRSFNMNMPEEVNRVLVDRISDILFCPSDVSKNNLISENIKGRCFIVGDIMRDCIELYRNRSNKDALFKKFNINDREYFLATIHRAENTDSKDNLKNILTSFLEISQDKKVLFPLHPRTRKKIADYDLGILIDNANIEILEPLSFFDTHTLLENSLALLTDSGGMQKEAFYYGVPCITIRDETEWSETISEGMNRLVGADAIKIVNAARNLPNPKSYNKDIYGSGDTSKKILEILLAK